MNTTLRDRVKRFRMWGSGGYSLVEMAIAVTVAVIIGMGLYAIFNAQQRSSRAQKTYNDLQTSCTFAMDTIKSDILLAGYRAKSSTTPVSAAAADGITFEFYDDKALIDPPYDDVGQYSNNTQVTYALAAGNLTKTIRRWHISTNSYDTPTTFTLAKNVQALNFQYLAQDNADLTAPVTGGNLDRIRTVRVSLKCRAEQANAIFNNPDLASTSKYQEITLTAEVRPRNIAVSSNPEDKTPPGTPTGLKVWDEGKCGCLQVRWTSNTESDIAGYTIFYGEIASGSYTGRARAIHSSGTDQYFTLQNLSATKTPYFIAIKAFDNSGNQSGLSTEVSANPGTSVRTEGAAGNDTAITPLAPPAPGGLSVATPEDNKLLLSWTKTYTDCMTTPVFGYRLYRSTNSSFTPDGTTRGVGNCIADESVLGATATSYLDTGVYTPAGKLIGCTPYYYKIAVVTCDPTQLSNYTNPGAGATTTYTTAQFASVTGTPTDGTAPVSPANFLSATPGYNRIKLELVNPTVSDTENPDFTFTRVYFSKTGYPVLTETRDADGYNVIDGGQLIPDNGGAFSGGGSRPAINFDSESSEVPTGGLGQPELVENATYYFLAVAYDRCKNHSQATDEAMSVAGLCKDGLVGEAWRDAPPAPADLRVTQGCAGSPLRIEWDYAPANYTNHPDFEGFRVLRRDGPAFVGGTNEVDLSGTTLISNLFWEDNTVTDGKVYSYRVEAGDCYYRKYLEGLLTAADIADNDPDNNKSWSDETGLALGRFDRAHVVGDARTTLAADVGAWDSTIPVTSTTGFTSRRFQIDAEIIECQGVTPTSFTDCWWRGAEGTFPIDHFAGTYVTSYPPAPPRAAVSGDLTLSNPTFQHNTVTLGARNTMDDAALPADSLTITRLDISWENSEAYLKQILYGSPSASIFEDTGSPLSKSSTGNTLTLSVPVAATADNVPLTFKYLKPDGTVDSSLDMRENLISTTWQWRNNTTGIDACSRLWSPTVLVPLGPVVSGTTQSSPTWGTVAWPVPGQNNNPMDAVVVPSGTWSQVSTNVHDTSGTGIASVRLYYRAETAGAGELTEPPDPTGTYPALTNYTLVNMSQMGGTETWWGWFPQWPATPADLDDKNIWYFIVATDNEGNFDREPEIDRGAFHFYQQGADPCLNTPNPPSVSGSATAASVTLDWASSFTPSYWNTNGSVCTDLAGFKVYYQMGSGGWHELASLGPTIDTYTHTFTTVSTSLTADITAALTEIPAATTGFPASGKIKIDGEIISYTGTTAAAFTGCTRAQDGTAAEAHTMGTSVIQDNLALEANSYYVRAYDSCSTGAKYSDSSIYTEGQCSPSCYVSVWPATGTSITAGESISYYLYACDKAGGVLDTIYVQACSSLDTDAVPITESAGNSGSFWINLGTSATDAGDSSTVIKVAANDTVTLGGYAATAGTWGTTCAGGGFSCGDTKTVTIAPAAADPCADSHTPSEPASLSYALIGSCKTEGSAPNNTKQLTLSWPTVTPPDSNYTAFGYKLYYCEGTACSPSLAKAFTYTCTGTTCTSATIEMPSQLKGTVYTFGVASSYEINNCPTLPTVRSWESTTKATTTETCTN